MIFEFEYRIITDADEKIYGIAVLNGDSVVDAVPSVCPDKALVIDLVKQFVVSL